MRVLFYYRNEENLAVEYLSAVLKQAGHKTGLLFNPGLDNIFFYRSRLLKVLQNKDLLVDKAVRFSPDLLAFSSITNEYPDVRAMAQMLKKRLKVPTIIGGIHPTAIPEFVLSDPSFDMVCVGEGEEALLELVDKMEKGKDYFQTRNIWFKKGNGTIIKNEVRPLISNLDSLPFPDKDLFYKYGCFKNIVHLISSRGCPYRCSYCHNHFNQKLYRNKGKYFRRRSVENVISEIKECRKKYDKINKVYFRDDLFVYDKEWLRKFSDFYSREVALPCFCLSSPTMIDDEVAFLLKRMGCKDLVIGIDSGSEDIRKKANRETPYGNMLASMKAIEKYKIPKRLSVMFGFPDEKPQDMWETISFIEKMGPNAINAYILYPYPETSMLNYCREKGLISREILLKIYKGEGSSLEGSIFEHPNGDLAYMITRLLPLYVRAPFFLRPLIKSFMKTRLKRLANTIFLLMVPFLYPYIGLDKLKRLFNETIISFRRDIY